MEMTRSACSTATYSERGATRCTQRALRGAIFFVRQSAAMSRILWLLIETLGSLLAVACVLRAYAHRIHLNPRNPISQFVSALTDIGYDGYACIEVEDRAFEGSRQKILDSLEISKRYMQQFVI